MDRWGYIMNNRVIRTIFALIVLTGQVSLFGECLMDLQRKPEKVDNQEAQQGQKLQQQQQQIKKKREEKNQQQVLSPEEQQDAQMLMNDIDSQKMTVLQAHAEISRLHGEGKISSALAQQLSQMFQARLQWKARLSDMPKEQARGALVALIKQQAIPLYMAKFWEKELGLMPWKERVSGNIGIAITLCAGIAILDKFCDCYGFVADGRAKRLASILTSSEVGWHDKATVFRSICIKTFIKEVPSFLSHIHTLLKYC